MPNNSNVRSQNYCILRALQRCMHCTKPTPVLGVILPAGHETLEADAEVSDRLSAGDVWEIAPAGALLFFVEYVPLTVQNRLHELSQYYRFDHCEQAGQSLWMNHCSSCGKQIADFEVYCEPEGAFSPISQEKAASIQLHEVQEPFEAQAAGYSYAPDFLGYVQRSGGAAGAPNLLRHNGKK